jgi:hypothetical protein
LGWHQGELVEGEIGAGEVEHHHPAIGPRLIERGFGGFGEQDLVVFYRRRGGDAEMHLELVRLAIEVERAQETLADLVDLVGGGFGGFPLEAELYDRAAGRGDPDVGHQRRDSPGDVQN